MKKKISYGKEADTALRSWIEISRAFTAIRRRENEYIESKGLTIHQFAVLEALYHLGPLTTGEITKLILSTPGNMTVVIKNLSAKGYIDVCAGEKDKRKRVLELTDDGEKLIAGIFPRHAENMAGYFGCLSQDEQETLHGLMRKLAKANREE